MKYKKVMQQIYSLDVKKEKKKQKKTVISLLEHIQNEINSSPVKTLISDEALSEQRYSSPEAQRALMKETPSWVSDLRKVSYKIIKEMMTGVKSGRYDPIDIATALKSEHLSVGHIYEFDFIRSLWINVRNKFRRYIPKDKLRSY